MQTNILKPFLLHTLIAVLGLMLAGSASALEVHYVDVNSTNATPPYTNWITAATIIQDAVDAAIEGDEILVTNGVYASVWVGKTLSVSSVNGAQFTIINGGAPCVHLTNNASVSGFTLTNGVAYNSDGGGAYGGTLNNCTLTRNRARNYNGSYSAGNGGGAAYCTLNNCTLIGNSTLNFINAIPVPPGFPNSGDFADGGGAYHCTLNNCTLTGNSTDNEFDFCANNHDYGHYGDGGGAAYCTLINCTLTGNSAHSVRLCAPDPERFSGDYGNGGGAYRCRLVGCIAYFNGQNLAYSEVVAYCCTWPLPSPDYGDNITNAPLFVDTNTWVNLRLQPNSPCINAGNNSYVTNANDLDGNPRISGGTVDIGAYEYQWPKLAIIPSGTNVILTWPTNAVGFTLQSATNLASLVWSTNSPAPVVIAGQNTVTNPVSGAQKFFRLVQ